MRMRDRAASAVRRGRNKASWWGGLALAGLMALPALTAPVAQAHPLTVHFRAPMQYQSSGYSLGVATGDVNGDSIPDIVSTNWYSDTLDVFLGSHDGGFKLSGTYTMPDATVGFPTLGDLNNDGKLDIAVSDWDNLDVHILLNNGDGTFTTGADVPCASRDSLVATVAVADVNGDSKQDLIFSEYLTNAVDVALGNGDGTFRPAKAYETSFGPVEIAVGDFNGDGSPDIAVGNEEGNVVSVLLNNTKGAFHTHRDYAVGESPWGVVTGDFNHDHHLDLAVGSYAGLMVLNGVGDGTFHDAVNYENPDNDCTGYFALAMGDFNGDGTLDVAASNDCDDSTLDVWANNGSGEFFLATTGVTAGYSISMAAGLFDHDTKADLVTANWYLGGFNVLLTSNAPDITLSVGNPSSWDGNALTVTNATPLSLGLSDEGDGAKTIAWRIYGNHAAAPGFSKANSTVKNLSLATLPQGDYKIQFYGLSSHGLASPVTTVYFTIGAVAPGASPKAVTNTAPNPVAYLHVKWNTR